MALWRLEPIEPWRPWFDCLFVVVVRADSEVRARQLVHDKRAGDLWEGKATEGRGWLDPAITACDRIEVDGEEEVLCADIHEA